MNNEIGRKITSLTLMTIMLAGGMVIAAPSMMPAAHAANANLFVSAENSQFDNYMSGPQVIEVVVTDSDINETNEGKGEPDVTVNGKVLRMVQGVDGNWYGYFADRTMAITADSTAADGVTEGLQFGTFCNPDSGVVLGLTALDGVTDTVGVAIPDGAGEEGSVALANNNVITTFCNAAPVAPELNNVVREAKAPSDFPAPDEGQIGIDVGAWPFIQLYPLNPTGNVVIQYNKGGGVQTTTLTFDTVDQFAEAGLDRASYTPGAEVHATITDLWLNIDPTDEDSWTFGTTGIDAEATSTTHYQVFDENGGDDGDTASNTDADLTDALDDLMCEDNCRLQSNADVQNKGVVLSLRDNDDSEIVLGPATATGTATFADNAADGLDDEGELTVIAGADLANFVNGFVFIQQGNLAAGATFTDDAADGLNAGLAASGELTLFTGSDLSDFDNGEVTISQSIDADNPFSWSTATNNLAAKVPVTITEQGPNSGVFGTYDESDNSNLVIAKDAKRGTSASITYNEDSYTILVALGFGSIDIQPIDDEWSSGEEIPVELFDIDANRNSRADEDLDLNNPDTFLIPSLQTGSPVTLGTNTITATLDDIALNAGNVQSFSDRAMLLAANAVPTIVDGDDLYVTFGTMDDVFDSTPINDSDFHGFALFNYDVRSLGNDGNIDSLNSVDIILADGAPLFTNGAVTITQGANVVSTTFTDAGLVTGLDVGTEIPAPYVDVTAGAAAAFVDGPITIAQGNTVTLATFTDDAADGLNIDTELTAFTGITIGTDEPLQGLILLDGSTFGALSPDRPLSVTFNLNMGAGDSIAAGTELPIVADVFGFGFLNDGLEAEDRIANQIIRLELEETGDNTSTFAGTLEYTMINQLNILDADTYEDLNTISDEATFIVIEDLTDEDSPRVNYLDLGADGVSTQVADQEEAPSHSGIVSFDLDTYKTADTVVITLQDLDLNVDSDLIDIYTTISQSSVVTLNDVVGDDSNNFVFSDGDNLGRVLDVTFDDELWTASNEDVCTNSLIADGIDTGLAATGFTLIETDRDSGEFIGDFQIPARWCADGDNSPQSATGLDIEVNYVDFRDASGEIIEVGDSAGVRANTGSISLDRTVYPVPFGVPDNFGDLNGDTSPDNRSIFAIHSTGINDDLTVPGSFLPNGDLTIHVRINDPDFDISANGEDTIAQNRSDLPVGPVEISILRGSETVILGYAGGPNTIDGTINVGEDLVGNGMIDSNSELTIINGGSLFTNGAVSIDQTGTPTPTTATATFTNAGTGSVDESELTITNSDTGFTSGVVSIDQGANNASATFTDNNGDQNVEEDELEVTSSDNTFASGPVTITQGAFSATATFADDTDSIDSASELSAITFGGSDFTTGTVTITQGSSTATATFTDIPTVTQFGPIDEIAPDAGIFELDVTIQYTDGPSDTKCPTTLDFDASTTGADSELSRFSAAAPTDENYCILQGDILQVEYEDPTDASGDANTVTDSATFDLRNGVLQSDKSVYIIGSDMILTLIEPDLDLDNDQAETWDLDLIEWDSDAATITMGDADGEGAAFDPEPLNFRETGDSTGIFQIVIEIPEVLENDKLERGEEIILEYTDWGPSGSDFVGDEDEDVNVTLFTSNFGATVELDQKVYTWTDKVYMTIVAPDHNFDGDLIDEIGNTDDDPIKISTRGFDIDNYKLVETGTDTGIFTGEIILTGFEHDADGKDGSDTNPRTSENGSGPTDGFLQTDDDDGLTVSFEFSEDETIVGSSLIRWNIGEVQWLEASYPASGTGVVRVIDPDMNLDPEAVDNFDVDVWSDSDAGGIDLTVTETNEATGIFEGTVFFTVADESSGHRLRVAEGDTVTAEYEDNTLPDPYTTADELDITATSLIGTIVPPLERAPAASLRTVDAFGNSLDTVSVDQQVQISADLANGQDREQAFAYLVQIQDGNGVTVALAWITGSLAPGQSFSPALSWIPTQAGTYTATAFVWESVDNPTALSPPVSTTITVR